VESPDQSDSLTASFLLLFTILYLSIIVRDGTGSMLAAMVRLCYLLNLGDVISTCCYLDPKAVPMSRHRLSYG
jgi:hypothetical protein